MDACILGSLMGIKYLYGLSPSNKPQPTRKKCSFFANPTSYNHRNYPYYIPSHFLSLFPIKLYNPLATVDN